MKAKHQLFIGGRWQNGKTQREIHSPFDDELVAEVDEADEEQIEQAIEMAHQSFEIFKKISRYSRSRLLVSMANNVENSREKFIERMILEAGKPRGLAEIEMNRALFTLRLAAEETKRFSGEIIPLDLDEGNRAYEDGQSFWFPRGPVLAITPFNFPLNLVIHKVAPALAVGATIVLKPAPQAPGCAALLAEAFEKAVNDISASRDKIPLSAFQVINGSNEVVAKAVSDPRLTILSFTGSDKVGWFLQGQAVRKKVFLELGGNAAVIVHSDADLNRAAARSAYGSFAYAGQSCISVQRIYVHQSVSSRFLDLLVQETGKLKTGDPRESGVVVGPLIDDNAVNRIDAWIAEAKKDGAQVITGGKRQGRVFAPTILTDVKATQKLNCEEVFGPVVTVQPYTNIDEAIESVNSSRFGLQAGIFTDSSAVIQKVFQSLDVGGVTVNEIPTFRADNMPYGGVKDSGIGREGIKYTMEDYSERRVLLKWRG